MKHPIQPIHRDEEDVMRFQSNDIIKYLFDTGAIDLNALALIPFSDDDRMQVAQLLGYSISGFSELSYASDSVVEEAYKLSAMIKNLELGIVNNRPGPYGDGDVKAKIKELPKMPENRNS